jgi:PTS system nitrogen regulatory IIA component
MDIATLLSPELVLCRHGSSSKKRIFEEIAEHLGKQFPDINASTIFEALIAREKLGSTGIGHGIAIPHCRIPYCDKNIAMFITLDKGIDYDSIDNEFVDVIFVLLVPEQTTDDHLKTLRQIAEAFSNNKILQRVRSAKDTKSLIDSVTIN